jgi:surfactin synthase thioesterase subunit
MRYFVFIASLLIVFGCTRNDRIPKNIISQNEMRKIMWDLMRADAYVSDFIMKDSTRDKKTESVILYEKVFAIHSTSQEAFEKSMTFYESRPDLLKVITDSLRSDEKKVQNYQDYSKKPLKADTTLKKIKPDKKILLRKQ